MDHRTKTALLLTSLLSTTTSFSAQPPDVVKSDVNLNTAGGTGALQNLPDGRSGGIENTAFGVDADFTGGGSYNTTIGALALEHNFGNFLTAIGAEAMLKNQSGLMNTAVGARSLFENDAGSNNVAIGEEALFHNEADSNSALGHQALFDNTTGASNSAFGEQALFANTVGGQNSAFGKNALHNSAGGSFNSVFGYSACWSCNNVNNNTAFGFKALFSNSVGMNNTAVGWQSGYNVRGSNNIDIANEGIAGDSGTIRIGAAGIQNSVFVAGITNVPLTGSAVVISASGQLGVQASSERYKADISTMTTQTRRLKELRPVTFRMKGDSSNTIQYGLIAEEVAKIYPELVIRDANGTIQGVRYDELAPILLLQAQNTERQFEVTEREKTVQADEIRALRRELESLKRVTASLAESISKQQSASLAMQ